MFSYTADKEIRTDDLCLDVSRLSGPVIMLKCHHMRGNQLWEYDAEVQYFLQFTYYLVLKLIYIFQIHLNAQLLFLHWKNCISSMHASV